MDPILAPTALAPSTSTSTTATSPSKPASWLEHHLGQTVAAAASTIAEALGEFQDGGLTSRTKGRGGELIFELFRLRQFLIANFPDFDRLARERGIEALRAATDGEIRPEIADELITAVLDILGKVTKAELN